VDITYSISYCERPVPIMVKEIQDSDITSPSVVRFGPGKLTLTATLP
jgi:hypothetical protein